MPRDGSGGYDRVAGTPYVANTTIDEVVVNGEMDDFGSEIANSLSKDGQTVPTANLPMGGYKHTGVGNATARDSYAALGQVQDGAPVYASAGGTGDALTLTLSPAPAAYAAGQEFRFKATATNATAATINVNSLGIKDIKRDGASALAAGDITSGQMYTLRYDGTNFQLLNASTFVTQAAGNSTTLPATTAMVQAAITARAASDTAAGIQENATEAEYQTGTATDRTVTVAVARAQNLVLSTAQATTSGTAIDFTGIPSWVKRITVMFSGISTTAGNLTYLQIGDSGGIETTGYECATTTGTSTNSATTAFLLIANTTAAAAVSGHAFLTKIDGNEWIFSGISNGYSGVTGSIASGKKTLSSTLDRIRLTNAAADTFDAGKVNIIYE